MTPNSTFTMPFNSRKKGTKVQDILSYRNYDKDGEVFESISEEASSSLNESSSNVEDKISREQRLRESPSNLLKELE